MNSYSRSAALFISIFLLNVSIVLSEEMKRELTLRQAVFKAVELDPWIVASEHQEAALTANSIAANTLPDPKMSISAANLPTDSFEFDQEGMTQLKLGVTQMFPRGDTLSLKRKRLEQLSRQQPFKREDRKAKIAVKSATLWLDAFKAQASIALIEKNRSLFEQLTDVAQASYSSALGKTRQQDIVRAQLELTRLEDRLTMLSQQEEMFKQKLSEQISQNFTSEYRTEKNISGYDDLLTVRLSSSMPKLALLDSSILSISNLSNSRTFLQSLENHPAINSVNQKIDASKTTIDLSKQKYKPEWGLSASYGYRDDTPLGVDRADLFSIGVTFDLPIFTSNRQDKEVSAAISRSESVKTEKWLLLRKFIAAIESEKVRLIRLQERESLYQELLLPQMHEQAEASLTAYTNDDGDFAEVVRARIAELNAELDFLTINVEKLKSIVQLNYYFMKSAAEVIYSADA